MKFRSLGNGATVAGALVKENDMKVTQMKWTCTRALQLWAGVILISSAVHAQPAPVKAEGTLVVMTGSAEMEVDNDEAVANFYLELQDADLSKAQSLVNQRVAQGIAAIKKVDAKAQLETSGYGAYPVYAPTPVSTKNNARNIVGWRVRQGVTLQSTDLTLLPKVINAAQQHLALGDVQFRLSRASREKHETELIGRALANFNAKVAAAAQALAVPAQKVRIEDLNFGGRLHEGPPIVAYARAKIASDVAANEMAQVSLESGRSTLQQNVEGRVRMLLP